MDVNRINPQTKYTALHNACWRGHIDVVRALLRHGADIHILNGEVRERRVVLMNREKQVYNVLK